MGPLIPNSVALDLYKRIVRPGVDDLQAAELLIQGQNRAALNYAVYAWRELLEAGRTNQAWTVLHCFLAKPEQTGVVIEAIREFLAHDNAPVRFAALDVLRRIGRFSLPFRRARLRIRGNLRVVGFPHSVVLPCFARLQSISWSRWCWPVRTRA